MISASARWPRTSSTHHFSGEGLYRRTFSDKAETAAAIAFGLFSAASRCFFSSASVIGNTRQDFVTLFGNLSSPPDTEWEQKVSFHFCNSTSGLSGQLRCRNLEHIIRQVDFRNTAIVDHDPACSPWQFNARCSCGFCAHLNPFCDLAAFKKYGERDFRSRIAQVFQRHGDKLHTFFRLPWMYRLHMKIRQAAILIHPVVEEPAQVALGGGFDQLLHIFWCFVIVFLGPILADGLFQRILVRHVA